MPHRFVIFNGTQRIGSSDLEHGNPGQGIREGRFVPEAGYADLEPLYQELTILSFEVSQRANDAEKRDSQRVRHEQLQEQAAALPLRVLTSTGQAIPTAWVHIEDFAAELGDTERQVTLLVDTYATYEQFFT